MGRHGSLPLYIVGAGGFGRETALLAQQIADAAEQPQWEVRGFVDARAAEIGPRVGKYAMAGDLSFLLRGEDPVAAVVGIGWPLGRRTVYEALTAVDRVLLPTLVHPTVVLDAEGVVLGRGTLVGAGCILTTDIRVGACVALNLACTIGHDVVIGDHCVLNPKVALSGGVTVGEGCLLGAGATVLQNLRVGAGAIVGAGAVVTRDVPPGATVVGVPAVSVASHAELREHVT